MKRIKEEFLDNLETVVRLKNKRVLEIGCGSGSRSIQIAKRAKHVTAIEPSLPSIKEAKKSNYRENIDYQVGRAEKLPYTSKTFDLAIFTLSLHHVPALKIRSAIREAIRVTKKRGHIVFLEPTHEGSFFEAEVRFDACDGDERKEKAFAYYSLLNHKGYEEVAELSDETIFQFDSYEDFVSSMNPKKDKRGIKKFLEQHHYTLKASRRISVFKVVHS